MTRSGGHRRRSLATVGLSGDRRRTAGKPAPHAFTLIEMLVVIAILVLLLSMLLPYLGTARELARLAACQQNMHTIGTAGQGFAAEHNGRGPGRGRRWYPTFSSIAWQNILNSFHFRESKVPRLGNTPAKNMLSCPSLAPWGNNYCGRQYKWNLDAGGGGNWSDNSPFEGAYGKWVEPNLINSRWDQYNLGAILSRFPEPSDQFMCVEGIRGSDWMFTSKKSPPYGVTLGVDWGREPWCSAGGTFTFRHMHPPGQAMLKQRARANFAFLDGHVEPLGASDRIDDIRRTRMRY